MSVIYIKESNTFIVDGVSVNGSTLTETEHSHLLEKVTKNYQLLSGSHDCDDGLDVL